MSKSVYSLVLMDDVVSAIDDLAYSMNTSRSNLINQILAEHVSLATPEMRMRDIFDSLQTMMRDPFQILDQPSDAMLSIRSQLKYKYNPTIRYTLELYRRPEEGIGRLRIAFRTQSRALLEALNTFFQIWTTLEQHYAAPLLAEPPEIHTDGTRYVRELRYPGKPGRHHRDIPGPVSGKDPEPNAGQSSEVTGQAIASYIHMLDDIMKFYFANLTLPPAQLRVLIETRYREYLMQPDFLPI